MPGSGIGEGERELQGSLDEDTRPALPCSSTWSSWMGKGASLFWALIFFFKFIIVIVNLELVPKRGFQKSLILYSLKLSTQFYVYWTGKGACFSGIRQNRIIVNDVDFGVKLTAFEVWLSQFTSIDTVTQPLWGSVFSSVKWVYPIELLLGWNESVHAKHLEEYSGHGKYYWSLAVMTK